MKKIFAFVMAIAMLMCCAACGNSDTAGNRLDDIKERGYIEVVTEPYFAPFEFIDSSLPEGEQFVGVDIELGQYIADKLGVELRIIPLEFTAVQSSIVEGKYDLALSALAYSPTRAEAMGMSNSYYNDEAMGFTFLIREEDYGKYEAIESVADAVIVTQSGSVQESIVNDQIKEYKEFKRVSSLTDGYLMVAEGKADACVCDIASAKLYAEANGGLTVSDFTFEVDPNMTGICAGVPLGEDELLAFVNECIAELQENGDLARWYAEYSDYAAGLGLD